MKTFFIIIALCCSMTLNAQNENITREPVVIDGDTLVTDSIDGPLQSIVQRSHTVSQMVRPVYHQFIDSDSACVNMTKMVIAQLASLRTLRNFMKTRQILTSWYKLHKIPTITFKPVKLPSTTIKVPKTRIVKPTIIKTPRVVTPRLPILRIPRLRI